MALYQAGVLLDKSHVGLGNADNDSTATIRSGTTASDVGLGNVTNESKATMFTSPAFTGTSSGINIGHLDGRVRGGSPDAAGLYTGDTFFHRVGSAGVYQSSGSTTHLGRYSRWWWGAGNVHIMIYEIGYGPNGHFGHFLCYGHTRSGSGSISTVTNNGVPTPYMNNYNGTHERCDIRIDTGAYYTYKTEFIGRSFYHNGNDHIGPNGGSGTNHCHFYSTTEVYT